MENPRGELKPWSPDIRRADLSSAVSDPIMLRMECRADSTRESHQGLDKSVKCHVSVTRPTSARHPEAAGRRPTFPHLFSTTSLLHPLGNGRTMTRARQNSERWM